MLGLVSSAHAQNAGSVVTLKDVHSGLCVDTGGSADFSLLFQANCSGASSQSFILQPAPISGYYYIINIASQLCWDLQGSSSSPGTLLQEYTCVVATSEYFQLRPVSSGFYKLITESGLCMGIVGGSTASGAQIQQNTCGKSSNQRFLVSSANVPAPVAPSISTQPASQTVTAGQAATFSVVASGTAPLSYQWNKNGSALSGATSSSYTTPLTTSSDNGAQFTVVVSNSAGSATSNAATLTVNAPLLQLTPTPANVGFGNVVTGLRNSQTISLANPGPASITISQATVSGTGFSISALTIPTTMAANASTTFSVVFAPASPGSVTGSVSLVSNASNSPLAIPLSGTGIAATYLLSANPTALSFGNVNLGTSNSLPVTLTNTGNSNVTISSVTPSGTGFSASGVSAGTVLSPNQSATLNASFAPTSAGSVTGSITVASNATNSPASLSLSASGVALPPTVAISSPTNGSSVSGTITVSGTASDTLGVSSVQVQVDGGAFSPASGTTNWSFPLDTSSLSNATHTLTARATNTSGATGTTSVSVNVSNSSATILNVKNFGAAGNGSTDDTAAINSAIAALQPGYGLFFPCGTYRISSGLNAIAANNVTVYGQTGCSSGPVAIQGTGSGATLLQVGSGQNLTSPTAITATTADLDPTFQANFAAIGASVGDYVFLSESVSSTDTTHTNCGGSGCRGEVLKITALNGNTATVETAVHNVYDLNDVPWVQKVLNPVSGVTVQNLLLDGSGAAMYALAVLNAVNLNVNNLTLQNVSCSAVAAVNGYNDSYATITITHAGTNSGCNIGGSAVSLQQQGNLNVNGVSISNMNVGAFGFIPFREANGTFSNISVDGTGTASGRLFKTNSAAHNVFNNISTNRDEGAYYQGITIEYFSHHNVWNNCKATNNISSNGSIGSNNGIEFYGDVANGNHQGGNHYNTFNNCTSTGNNGVAMWVSDNNNNIEINGGTWSGIAGQPVIEFGSPCCANNAYIHNASISGPGTAGMIIDNGSIGACINNNTFGPGLSSAINVTASSDIGSGNALNALSSNLNPGTCGASPTTFGYPFQGALVGSTMSNSAGATRYQMAGQSGTVVSMSVFIASPVSASPNNQFQVAIYADNNGTPGALIASSASQTIVPDAWDTVPISAPVAANAYYWLVYNTNGLAANTNNVRYDSGGASFAYITPEPFGTWPTTFGPVSGTSILNLSIYATFH